MTGTFSIKRRKQDTPRPNGQSSQRSLLSLGIGVGRSSPHTASKRGHIHVGDLAADGSLAFARAQEWHLATGKPLPPHMRTRRPVQPPAALDVRARFAAYAGYDRSDLDHLTTARLLDARPPGPRRRRLLHKAGAHGERPAGWQPQRPAQGRRAPKSPAAQRRARKNAAQQARHQARVSRDAFLRAVVAEHAGYLDEIAQP